MRVDKNHFSLGIGRWCLVALSLLLILAAAVPVQAGAITGKVTNSGGTPLEGVWVDAYDLDWNYAGYGQTDASGVYTIDELSAGSYKVVFEGQWPSYVSEWYQDKPDFEDADAVAVTAGSTTAGIDASLEMPGSITGKVTNSGGTPLEGVGVCAYDLSIVMLAGCGTTDAAGAYTISGLSTGSYKVEFDGQGSGYFSEWYQDRPDFETADTVAVTAGSTTPGIDASLEMPGSITGKVTNSGGTPLEGVWVYAFDLDWYFAGAQQTDAAGIYTISGLSTGSYKVEFDGQGSGYFGEWYQDRPDFETADTVAVTAGSTTPGIDVSLATPGSITGKVTGAGRALEGVVVDAYDLDWNYAGYGWTDASGVYTIDWLPAGSYKVEFYSQEYPTKWYRDKPDFETADAVAVTAGSTTLGIDASLATPGSITGKVTGAGGKPLEGAGVCAYDLCENSVGCTSTDASGVYIIDGLSTGRYKVHFTGEYSPAPSSYLDEWYKDKPDFATALAVAVMAESRTTGVNASLSLGGSITGKVTGSGGTPLEGVRVVACDTFGNGVGDGQTNASGLYTIGRLPTGKYKVEFAGAGPGPKSEYLNEWYRDKPDFETAIAIAVTTGLKTSGINASLMLGGSITGTVTDSGGNALEGVEVCAYGLTGDWAGCESTDSSGVYAIGGLPTGTYRVEFQNWSDHLGEWYQDKPDFDAAAAIAVTAGSTTTGIDASLALGGSIAGTVTDSGGNPLAGVDVCAHDLNNDSAGCGSTDSSGVYTIGRLHSGSYKVEFQSGWTGYLGEWYQDKPDFATADAVAVTAESTTAGIDASLTLGGSITGTVTDSGGNPLRWVGVVAYDANGNWIGDGSSDFSGVYSIGGLPAGNYKVEFDGGWLGYLGEWYQDKPDFATADAVAVTAESTTAGIDASLTLGGYIAGTVTGAEANPLKWVEVAAYDGNGNWTGGDTTDASGVYSIGGLPTGSYKVEFGSLGSYLGEWYQDKPDFDTADAVAVTAELATSGIDASLALGGSISGTVTPSVRAAGEVEVRVYSKTGDSLVERGWGFPMCDGTYTVGGLPAGSYYVQFDPGHSGYLMEFYDNAVVVENALPVAVSAGKVTSGIDADLVLDTKAPANGTLTVTPGPAQNILSWTGFSDGLNGSGIDSYKVVFAIGTIPASCSVGTAVYQGPHATATHAGLSNRTYSYRVCAIDRAGNSSSGAVKSAKPLNDGNPPTGTVKINTLGKDPKWTKSAAVTLSLTATDASASIQMCISNSETCTAWTAFTKTKSWKLTRGNGQKTVNAWFRDTWGNRTPEEAPTSYQIGLDTIAPANGMLNVKPGSGYNELDWTTPGFTDVGGSGVAGYLVVFKAGTLAPPCATGTAVPGYDGTSTILVHSSLVNGTTYAYRVCAVDAAGNISSGATKTGKPTP